MVQDSTVPYQPFTPEYITPQPPYVVPIIESAPVSTSFLEAPSQPQSQVIRQVYLSPSSCNTKPSTDPLIVLTVAGLLGLFGLLAFLAFMKR